MEYSKWPRLGIQTSKLGFGAMRFPQKGEDIDQEQVDAMIKYAYDNGVNYYDTAYVYGNGASERALGKSLSRFDRSTYFVADKMPFFQVRDNHLESIFAETLENLGMDYVDFYLMHAMNDDKMKNVISTGAVEWAKKKREQGKIKYLGFSIHDGMETLNAMLDLADWDFVQIQYNYLDLLDRPGQAGYLELVKRNIPIIVMEPLKGGMLSDLPLNISKPYGKLGKSNVDMAFRWLAQQPGIATILSGMSSLSQVTQNVDVFSGLTPLSQEEEQAVAEVCATIQSLQKVSCTGCRYCMPCPSGVEIPTQFKAWNTKALNQGSGWLKESEIDYEQVEKCVECGKCLTFCPQHIDIPTKLKEMLAQR